MRSQQTPSADETRYEPTIGAGETAAQVASVGFGAVCGGAAGAVIGAVGGPVGAASGAVAGVVAGAIAGEMAAETFADLFHTEHESYWAEHHRKQPYVMPDEPYEKYRDAFELGWDARQRHPEAAFEDVAGELEQRWLASPRELPWPTARQAAKDAWDRVAEQ